MRQFPLEVFVDDGTGDFGGYRSVVLVFDPDGVPIAATYWCPITESGGK